MKKIVLTSLCILIIGIGLTSKNNYPYDYCLPDTIEVKSPPLKPKKQKSNLIEALIYVESRGKEDCIGDKHLIIPSVGVLQIRPIMVREVNRILVILGENQLYKNKDRYSRQKSIEMFIIWRDFHHKDDSDEIIARCWNGGPKGWKRKSTLKYWSKVKKQLNKNK